MRQQTKKVKISSRIKASIAFFIPFAVVLTQQACSQVKFSSFDEVLGGGSSSAPANVDSSASSNGGTYGGKLRILHHYVDNFTCEGRQQPESILIQTDTQWLVIQNTEGKCADVDQAPVTNVTYDDVNKVAIYNDQKYVAPKDPVVDPNEDPNLPDIKPIDGVCEDVNHKCSLAAAIMTANMNSSTAVVNVIVPRGTYRLTQQLILSPMSNTGYDVNLKGSASIIDGGGTTSLFYVTGENLPTITIDNFIFQNASSASTAASVFDFNGRGIIQITNSVFQNNSGGYVIASGLDPMSAPDKFMISNTQFLNNMSSFSDIRIWESYGSILDQVSIIGGSGYGFNQVASMGLQINRSYVAQKQRAGIYYSLCENCEISNTTVANNGGDGILLFQNPMPSDVFLMTNVTLAHNGTTSGYNLNFDPFTGSSVQVRNTIFLGGTANCLLTNASSISASNSIFNDSSCAAVGTGNITGDPQLAPPAMNGGPTMTMLPAASSPAINAGDDAACSGTDQRGLPRLVGAHCDVGAVEVQ